MHRKRTKLLSLLLIVLIGASLLNGCQTNKPDDIMAMVGETPVYRWYYEAYLADQLELNQKYQNVDLTQTQYASEYAQYKKHRLNDLASEAALLEEARILGLDQLTPEQESEVDRRYNDYYNQCMDVFLKQYGTDDNGRRKAEQAYLDFLKGRSLTPDLMRESIKYGYIMSLFVETVAAQEPITDEILMQIYEERLKEEQEKYAADKASFGKNVGDTTIYYPEGYYDTVRIMLKFTDKHAQGLNIAYTAMTTAVNEYLTAVQGNESSLTISQKQSAMDRTTSNLDDLLDQYYAELGASMQSIIDELNAGADFITLMEEKTEDTHLISYYVCPESDHVEETYLKAAMALKNEGDISGIVELDQGVCIIKLLEILEPGARPFEEVKDALYNEITTTNNRNLKMSLESEYYEKADEAGLVTIYEDKL